jgi:hypothetical protein
MHVRHEFDVGKCLLCASLSFSLLNIFTNKHVSFNDVDTFLLGMFTRNPHKIGSIISCVSCPLLKVIFLKYVSYWL